MKKLTIEYKTLEPLMHFTDQAWPLQFRSQRDPRTKYENESWANYTVMVHEGKAIAVPCVSGNSFRGKLRRLLAYDIVHRLGLEIESLPHKLIHLLFNGGGLEESSKKAENKEATSAYRFTEKEVRSAFPHLDLLGVSFGTRMMRGLIAVSDILPLAQETASVLEVDVEGLVSVHDLTHWRVFTRQDELTRLGIETEEKSAQMIYKAQYIVANTKMKQRIHWLVTPNSLQEAVLATGLKAFMEKPYLGGKSNLNFGRVDVVIDAELDTKDYDDFDLSYTRHFLKEYFNVS